MIAHPRLFASSISSSSGALKIGPQDLILAPKSHLNLPPQSYAVGNTILRRNFVTKQTSHILITQTKSFKTLVKYSRLGYLRICKQERKLT